MSIAMKRIFPAIAIVLLLAGNLLAGPIHATYRIAVSEPDGTAYGTGTAISPNHVVTNSHVVGHRITDCRVYNSLGQHSGRVIVGDSNVDLAIIYVAEGGLEYVPVSKSDPKAGDKVQIFGFGRQGILRGESGTVQPVKFSRTEGCPVVETDMGIEQGDSGSGMFNAAGQLVAVQWCSDGSFGQGAGRSGATPVSCLWKLTKHYETQCAGSQCLPWSRGYIGIGGGVGIGYGSQPVRPLRPVQPPSQRPQQPPAEPPIQPPVVPVTPPAGKACECNPEILVQVQADLKAAKAQLATMQSQVQSLTVKVSQVANAPPPSIDLDDLLAKLPPIKVVFEDADGKPSEEQTVQLGGTVRMPAQRLHVIKPGGEVQQTAKPLGQPLRLQLENVKVAAP